MLRLFVGLDLPDAARRSLALSASGIPGARWLDPASYHVTLAFVGEVDEGVAEDLDHELSQVEAKAFALRIAGVGSFEGKGKLRSLWAGVELTSPLEILQGRIVAACLRAGVDVEKRKFKPHVSLARFKERPPPSRLGAWFEAHSLLNLEPIPVDAFLLFRSHLGGEGAHYEALVSYPLRGV